VTSDREYRLSLGKAGKELVGRNVDQVDFIGTLEDRIRNRLPDDRSRNLRDGVGPALEVLDIERRVHVDPAVKKLLDIPVTFRMPGPRGICMSEFVDEDKFRLAGEYRIQIHLLDLRPRYSTIFRGRIVRPSRSA